MNIALTIGLSAPRSAPVIGVLVVPLYNVQLSTTAAMISASRDCCAGVVGGFGYLPGAIVGGLLLGVVENIASMVLPSHVQGLRVLRAADPVHAVPPVRHSRAHRKDFVGGRDHGYEKDAIPGKSIADVARYSSLPPCYCRSPCNWLLQVLHQPDGAGA